MSKKIKLKSTSYPPDFDWKEYVDDRKRIKALTKKYEDKSIVEAFSKEYNEILSDANEEYKATEYSNMHPIAIGQDLDVTVDAISKKDALVSYHSSKDQLRLKQTVGGWNIKPGDTLKVSVIDKSHGEYVVDAIEPLYRDWINRVNSTLKNTFQSFECRVKDLVRQTGGYTGKIVIPEITSLTGKPYEIDAFIPGGQIALNIEHDFDKWVGKNVDTMITNFSPRGVVCSRKKLLNVEGCNSLVNIYDAGYGRGDENNVPFTTVTFEGTITGIINSAKKQGVFVEIPDYNITGLIKKEPSELVNYHVGDSINVIIDHFDFDPKRGPYRRDRDGILTDVSLQPVFVEK